MKRKATNQKAGSVQRDPRPLDAQEIDDILFAGRFGSQNFTQPETDPPLTETGASEPQDGELPDGVDTSTALAAAAVVDPPTSSAPSSADTGGGPRTERPERGPQSRPDHEQRDSRPTDLDHNHKNHKSGGPDSKRGDHRTPTEIVERAIDGSGTNTENAGWGAVGQELLRLGPVAFADGIGEMVSDRPGAREISNAVAAQQGDMPNAVGASDFLWAWGQFIDHDLDLTEAGHTEFAPIIAPVGDPWLDPDGNGDGVVPFTRVDPLEGTGSDTPRQYANEITAFIDGGTIYGSDAETAAALRGEGGRLLLDGDFLYETEDGVLTGDIRAAENVALTSLHTLFVREHNRWVEELAELHPDWSDDDLFNAARMRVEAEMQAITYNEFLPLLVGEGAISAYRGYDDKTNPGISVEFSTAAFRFGHTLLSASIGRLEEDGSDISAGALALREAFFNPGEITTNGGIDPILRGLAAGQSQEIDTKVVEDVRSFLFSEGGSFGLDLASLNIQRGRDLGVSSYNDLREALGLERAEAFSDITSDTDLAATLELLYGDVDLVDAWVGGLAEDAYGNGMLGELFATIIIDQFERIRDGDPFWSQAGHLSDREIDTLWDTTLSDVILANTDIGSLQENVFLTYDRVGGTESDDDLAGTEGRDLILGFAGDDTLAGGGGVDQIEGGAGSDRIIGGAGNDFLLGGTGADIFFFDLLSGRDRIGDFGNGDQVHIDTGGEDVSRDFVRRGDDVVLRLNSTTEITLESVRLSELDPNDFLFV